MTKAAAKTQLTLIPSIPTISRATAAAREILPIFVLLTKIQSAVATPRPMKIKKRLYRGNDEPSMETEPLRKSGAATERYSAPQTSLTRSPKISDRAKVK